MPLPELVRKSRAAERDWLAETVRWLVQESMETEVGEQIGADKHERRAERTT